ncbi:hypothetical protein OH77DRAFT_561681 [Trametes cingulata]|nr:hypothetical protein OH77DRAFT_561681 [Trametes cingulata]
MSQSERQGQWPSSDRPAPSARSREKGKARADAPPGAGADQGYERGSSRDPGPSSAGTRIDNARDACPSCGDGYAHGGRVPAQDRSNAGPGESARSTRSPPRPSHNTSRDMSDNPLPRPPNDPWREAGPSESRARVQRPRPTHPSVYHGVWQHDPMHRTMTPPPGILRGGGPRDTRSDQPNTRGLQPEGRSGDAQAGASADTQAQPHGSEEHEQETIYIQIQHEQEQESQQQRATHRSPPASPSQRGQDGQDHPPFVAGTAQYGHPDAYGEDVWVERTVCEGCGMTEEHLNICPLAGVERREFWQRQYEQSQEPPRQPSPHSYQRASEAGPPSETGRRGAPEYEHPQGSSRHRRERDHQHAPESARPDERDRRHAHRHERSGEGIDEAHSRSSRPSEEGSRPQRDHGSHHDGAHDSPRSRDDERRRSHNRPAIVDDPDEYDVRHRSF